MPRQTWQCLTRTPRLPRRQTGRTPSCPSTATIYGRNWLRGASGAQATNRRAHKSPCACRRTCWRAGVPRARAGRRAWRRYCARRHRARNCPRAHAPYRTCVVSTAAIGFPAVRAASSHSRLCRQIPLRGSLTQASLFEGGRRRKGEAPLRLGAALRRRGSDVEAPPQAGTQRVCRTGSAGILPAWLCGRDARDPIKKRPMRDALFGRLAHPAWLRRGCDAGRGWRKHRWLRRIRRGHGKCAAR